MGSTKTKGKRGAKAKQASGAPDARRQRELEWRARDKAEGEARVLAWWSSIVGVLPDEDLLDDTGRPIDPFCNLVGYRDLVCAVRSTDMRNPEHVERIRDVFFSNQTMPPVERLELAGRILNAVDVALRGDDPRVWRAIEKALGAMALDPRFAVIEHMIELAKFRTTTLDRDKHTPLDRFRQLSETAPVRRIFASLRKAIQREAPNAPTLTDEEVFAALEGVSPDMKRGRGKKSVFVAAARIAVDRRLWGAMVSKQSDDGKRDVAVSRYARVLSQAWTMRHRPPKKSTRTR